MQLGIDFDGTLTKYIVCYRSGCCDGLIAAQSETLEGAKKELKSLIRHRKNVSKCWIVKQTVKYEKVYEIEIETDNKEQQS